ncbi:hypothetical protein C0Q70_17005 [Pomacea canaliculata]|uniref:ornithine decarboxylase n=1 Tax=Pomacea canaliculata TaxID=400727 RepID=A0A2T7NRF6_POMCA|nr:ornithine decarboxylase-like [Pomacea canaliculata]PVD23732.1 hypothetical protein C0Q70_17005 [Pomacea canaliculata]
MRSYNFGKGCKVELHGHGKPIMEIVQEKVAEMELKHKEDAFYLADLGDVVKKYEKWSELLPRVEPFYAVKCNPDLPVLKLLAHLGAGFDCASKDEIAKVLKFGVPTSKIIYANPCKQNAFIRYAAKQDVQMMTFDNEAELYKVKAAFPNARLVLRILPPANFKVQCELGNKFGCHPKDARALLMKALELDLNVIGISFHCGSGVGEAAAFSAAVEASAEVFDIGQSLGFDFDLLDIGGGFPGHAGGAISFEEVAEVLNDALNKYFPPKRNVRIIGEPGRYFVSSAFNLTVSIIAKRMVATDAKAVALERSEEPAFMYYVNDGVYGSFNCLLYDHAKVEASLVNAPVNAMEFRTSIWGPTCDGLDQILKEVRLPELCVGDYLNFPNMGAYTVAAGTTFNGMPRPEMFYHCSENVWCHLFPDALKAKGPGRLTGKIPFLKAGHDLDKVEHERVPPSPVVLLDADEDAFFN